MRKLLLIVVSLFTVIYSHAQDLEKSLLWKISGNGLETPSFIFGTIHATCDASVDESVKTALDETTLLVLELDMDDPEMAAGMMKGMYMKDNKSIKDLATEEEYKLLEDFIKTQVGMPLQNLNTVKPFFLSAMMIPKLLDCPMQSFEQELMQVAQEQNEEILGLETIEEQLKVFDDIPYEDQLDDLIRSARDSMQRDKEMFKEMQTLYSEKDLEGLMSFMEKNKDLSTAKYSDILLTNRNKNWISKIAAHSKKQPTFFGVGAAHLPGAEGVLNLLEKEGYTVTAVK